MSPDEVTPSDEKQMEAPKPKATVKPLSSVNFGPFSVLIFDRQLNIPVKDGTDEIRHEVMVNIRREARGPLDDTSSIPLTDLPALQMILKEIAGSAMTVQQFTPPQSVTPPSAEPPKPGRMNGPKKAVPAKKR